MRTFQIFAIVLLGSTLCRAQEPAKRELPKLSIVNPVAEERYDQFAGIEVFGRIESETMNFADETVRIALFHVRDDGQWAPQGSCTVTVNAKNEFSTNLLPSSPGWRTGALLVQAQLVRAKAVRDTVAVEAVPRNSEGAAEETTTRPPTDSKLVIDGDQPRKSYRVPAETEFRIRGTIPTVNAALHGALPGVRAKIVTLPAADEKETLLQNASSRGFIDGDGKWWYELLLVAPKKPGTHRLRVTTDWAGVKRPQQLREDVILIETSLTVKPADKPD
jgi:hypothetical protein